MTDRAQFQVRHFNYAQTEGTMSNPYHLALSKILNRKSYAHV